MPRPRRRLRRHRLPSIDHSTTHVPPERKALAERRMADFDRYPRELRDIINGIGDNPAAARGFLARGVLTTRDAEDLRARIGLERAEAAAAERIEIGTQVAESFKRTLRREPAVDRGAARAQAQRILRGMAS